MDNRYRKLTGGQITGTVLFFLSYVPFLYAIYCGLNGIVFGLQGFARFFGISGVILGCLTLTVFGILPACIVYQIIFGVKVIRHNKPLRITTFAVVGALLFVAFLTEPVSRILKAEHAIDNIDEVNGYLSDKYDHNVSVELVDAEIDAYLNSYSATSPVLPGDSTFTVSDDSVMSGNYSDNLVDAFLEANPSYMNQFCIYVKSKYDIPETANLGVEINNIQFGDYKDGDDYTVLFDKTDYTIDEINIYADDFKYEMVYEVINQVWNDIYPQINNEMDGGFLTIWIYHDDNQVEIVSLYGKGSFSHEDPHAEITSYMNPEHDGEIVYLH